MRLGQIRFDNKITAAVFESGLARPVPGYSMVELIRKTQTENVSLPELAAQMASHHAEEAPPVLPINPVEVWGCGCVYEAPRADGCPAARPALFFKGTSRVCIGPGQQAGIRFDSKFTMPQPGLAVVLGRKGEILGYTIGNDISACDLELENPRFFAQAKIYSASCVLGPVIVTADEVPNPYALEIACSVSRGGTERFTAKVSTAQMHRRLEELVDYLLRANPVPAGSVLLTGSGIQVSPAFALEPGDTISVCVREIGQLSNTAAIVK